MIPTTTAAQLQSSAKETTESVSKAIKSFYANAAETFQCTETMAMIKLPSECNSGRDVPDVTLDWHGEPHTTMSDLTLVVYDGSGGTPYHVHTILLAFGGRKSGFVQEQLKQQQKKNSSLKEYKIEIYVPPLAACHMPQFLDYIYGSEIKLSTDSAPPLRYLSNRFDVRELHERITKSFLPQDLELATAPRYCMAADELKDYELRDKSLRIMAERMERMNAAHLKHMTPRLMRSLVQCERVDCGGAVLSEKVAQWLRCRDAVDESHDLDGKSSNESNSSSNKRTVATLSDEDFYWITHVQIMPQISQHEALFYLHYGTKYPSVMNEVGPGSLKHRCLQACTGQVAMELLVSHLQNPDQVNMDMYQHLDNELKVQLLENAMVSAKKLSQDRDAQANKITAEQEDISSSNELTLNSLHKELECPSLPKTLKVVVHGCGIPTANGVYLADNPIPPPRSPKPKVLNSPRHPQDLTYEKEAVWNNTRVVFILAPCRSGKYYTHYKLGVRQGPNSSVRMLYTSPTLTGEGSMVIPEVGWEVQGEEREGERGIGPAPFFVGRIAED